jgi:myo-inositol catabolism protein IolC
VRYNPEGDKPANERQAGRLQRLSEYLHRTGRKYMFELLVPATPEQLRQVGGDRKRYDLERRPSLMVRAIRELQEAGVEPDIWKIEGLDRREDCARVAETARRDGRGEVGCIVLGRGEDEAQVHAWLTTAAGVPGFIGFAVGRTTFWEPLTSWREQKNSRDDAVAEIARRYRQWVDVFERAHTP